MPTQTDTDAAVLALIQTQAAIRDRLNAQAVAMATRSAQSFGGWYSADEITSWATSLSNQIETVQRTLAQSTDAYLARVLSILTGAKVRPVGRVDVTGLRTGVTHPGAYGRAADVYRWQQSRLDTFARDLPTQLTPAPPDLIAPLEAAVQRAVAVADYDVQLAARAQSKANMQDADSRGLITGWRRVIHPELSRTGSCGLCIAASDRIYHSKDLLPIHGGCNCTVLPIINTDDPGLRLNRADLDRLYNDAGGTNRAGLKRTRYQIDEHGELGPVLNPAGTKVRTAAEAAKAANQAKAAKTDVERLADVRRIRDSLEPARVKAEELAASDPGQWKSYLSAIDARIADLDTQLAAPVAA